MDRKHNKSLTPLAKTLRKDMTAEERHLWYDFLRNYPVRFRRQMVIGSYIVDFYCHEARLVVELDGSQHYEPGAMTEDLKRTAEIEKHNLKVIRFTNLEVKQNFEGVCEAIDREVKTVMT